MYEKLDLTNIKNAMTALEEALTYYNTDVEANLKNIIADSCIQRFEYSYEITWKLMKKYLKIFFNKSEQDLTIKNIFRFMEGYELVNDWVKWSEYNDARNSTSHEYNLNKAKLVLSVIPNFLNDTKEFVARLERVLSEN